MHNQLVSAYIGSDVELECSVEASPKPETVWLTSDGQRLDESKTLNQRKSHGPHLPSSSPNFTMVSSTSPITPFPNGSTSLMDNLNVKNFRKNKKKYYFDENSDGYRTIVRLTIRHIDSYDFGSYKCLAKNKLGEKEGLIRLYGMFARFKCFFLQKNIN